MESLLANYASSDEEEENHHHQNRIQNKKISVSVSASASKPFLSSSSLFSSLPQPKTQTPQQPISNLSSLEPKHKKVVQFKPPINPSSLKPASFDEEEEEEKEEEEKKRKQRKESQFTPNSSSVKSFLSSIPMPKNSTLGPLSAAGTGRKSIIETEAPTSTSGDFGAQIGADLDHNAEDYARYESGSDHNHANFGSYDYHESGIDQGVVGSYGFDESGIAQSVVGGGDGIYYGSYDSHGNYGDYAQYGNNWVGGSVTGVLDTAGSGGSGDSAAQLLGKRGRNAIPTEIVEVKQDELTKDRPRADQVKLTGIAFGPSYPPTSSAKGKPSKLHKRKHQIGSLYFDMKQKETELAERRAKGFLTKAQTQGKYGW